jgi:aldehyde dehydrogenase (NAD+)
MAQIKYGDPTDPQMLMGPLCSARQRERVEGYIRKGIEEGAKLVTGGKRPAQLARGYFIEPTLFANVDPNATIAQEEIFGPVLSIIPYDDEEHAIAIANNSKYGLSGAVFSRDAERARRVARRIRTGTMILNGGVYYGPEVPFGGYKHSGLGRENGRDGFEEFLEVKALAEPA